MYAGALLPPLHVAGGQLWFYDGWRKMEALDCSSARIQARTPEVCEFVHELEGQELSLNPLSECLLHRIEQ